MGPVQFKMVLIWYFYEDVLVFSKLRGPLWAESRFCGQKVSSYFGVLVIGPRKFLLNTRWTIFVDLVSRYPKMTYEDFVELIKVILMVCVALLDHVCIRRYNTICDLLRSESYGISSERMITFTVLMSVHGDETYSFALCYI